MTAAPYPYSYGPPPAQPIAPPPAGPAAFLRLLAGILGALAAVLVIAGTFLPQTSFEQVVDGKTESSQTITAWSRSFAVEPGAEAKKFYEQTHVARYGIPLTAGAVVLLAGAGLAFAGARRTAGPGLRAGARTALVAGAAGVTAAVWMLGMDVSATLSYETDEGTVKSHYATGTGFWLLLGGGIVALVTLVVAVLAGRRAPAAIAGGPPPAPYAAPAYPQQYPPGGPYGGPQHQPFPAPPPGGPQPFGAPPASGVPASGVPASGPPSQPFVAQPPGAPQSQPFPAQPPAGSRPFPGSSGEAPEPGGVSSRLDDPYGGVTQAQPHPSPPGPASPTEPNYQLPPLNPPNT
ncbi:hypothetical protein [Amycolatopsis sp. CA-128772]|uniref:hypothetical protein n=1 Tax=Amycolatopsis sp. CA-128772 TaxID=2073159 RepID=UPI000CD02DF2|nr:hypothetical protein [Amycolatopsis sp. CA-128772]